MLDSDIFLTIVVISHKFSNPFCWFSWVRHFFMENCMHCHQGISMRVTEGIDQLIMC